MKKITLLFLGLISSLVLSSCGLGSMVDKFSSDNDEPVNTEVKTRVYMDEVRGTLVNFDGAFLTIQKADESLYTFDVSEATLECEGGMITGDTVSVIYEGKISDNSTDTSAVHALKVTDELHKTGNLAERSGCVQIISISPNTISVRSRNGGTASYLIAGVEQYYENGIIPGAWVYVHFKGNFSQNTSDDPTSHDASHIKVISVSDVDPLVVPVDFTSVAVNTNDPAKAPTVNDSFRASIQGLNNNILSILPAGAKQAMNVPLNNIPIYLKGGAAPGSYVNVFYTGQFNGTSLTGTNITRIVGDDPDTLTDHTVTSTFTGAIVASTANTITVQTNDGATITCNTDNARDTSTNGLAIGSVICATFNPADNKESNIYQCVAIKDAL